MGLAAGIIQQTYLPHALIHDLSSEVFCPALSAKLVTTF